MIELDSTHVNALLARGACLNKVGSFKEAFDDYDAALRLDEEKNKAKKSRHGTRRKEQFNEEDIVKPN